MEPIAYVEIDNNITKSVYIREKMQFLKIFLLP